MENPNQKYDEFFMEILQDKKTVVGFLQTIFSFLARRTDFYHDAKKNPYGLGFPPGIKEKLVQQVLQQYDPKRQAHLKKQSSKDVPSAEPSPEVSPPPISKEVEVQTTIDPPPPTVQNKLTRTAVNFLATESYNGAQYESYCWSQTITDIELHIILPDHVSTSKQLNIKIEPDCIQITDKLSNSVVLDGKLSAKCRSSEAVWSISNRKLQITLDKVKETWWDRLLDTEPKLNLSKMDCSRPLEELPQESQAVIEKLRWDQQQKALGLPTSDDLKNRKILETAWNAEGSPFKGQPFDPSIVKFN